MIAGWVKKITQGKPRWDPDRRRTTSGTLKVRTGARVARLFYGRV